MKANSAIAYYFGWLYLSSSVIVSFAGLYAVNTTVCLVAMSWAFGGAFVILLYRRIKLMSIDARVEEVEFNNDGSGMLKLIDRPARPPGQNPGIAGQTRLYFPYSCEEVAMLEGKDIWGNASSIMLGNKEIARRASYTVIHFHGPSQLAAAIALYSY